MVDEIQVTVEPQVTTIVVEAPNTVNVQVAQILGGEGTLQDAVDVRVDASQFNGVLAPTDTNLQLVAEKVDAIKPLSYKYTQLIAADTWIIDHNLDMYPSVVVIDSASSDEAVFGAVRYPTKNTVIITFGSPFTGEAYLT